MIFPFTYRYLPNRMNFAINPKHQNKIPLIILSQKHAHYEYFSSLSFLLFNSCHIIARLIFVAFNYGVEILAKRTSPSHCNQAFSSYGQILRPSP